MLEPLLWVLIPLLLLTLGFWLLTTVRRRNSRQVAESVTPEAAEAAAGRMSPETHRDVYRHLATGNFLTAVQEYRNGTGIRSVKECIIDVRSLEAHPQVLGGGTPQREEPIDSKDPGTLASGPGSATEAPEQDAAREPNYSVDSRRATGHDESLDEVSGDSLPDVIPADWTTDFHERDGRQVPVYRITEQSEGETHEYSTEDLPPAEADQFQSLMRDSNYAGAAELFARFSGLTRDRIQPLLESAPTAGAATLDGVSDFGFEGDGPEGRVSFNSADLPAGARENFLEHLAAGRLDEAGRIVSEHTGLPDAVIQQVLASFNEGRDH
ncbi:hypothetical protein [Zhihengliuella flava]|uniref:Uncharacterized protein n=1 Tax=Zhihengliuella flava TaxID=1285193 RepID=A0A931DE72_9MICC|nr:hypothetical protein [Zhihengliuella flava]MBG6085185.1 hypothetical protein [Zhihengliuella flava]